MTASQDIFQVFPIFAPPPHPPATILERAVHQNWNFIHLLLIPMLMKALGTFSNSRNHSWLSRRKRIPPSGRLLWPSTPTWKKKTTEEKYNTSPYCSRGLIQVSEICGSPYPPSQEPCSCGFHKYGKLVYMLSEHALPVGAEHERRIQNGCVAQKLSQEPLST